MTELSTADLAGGGTTARTVEDEARVERLDRDDRSAPVQGSQPDAMTPRETTGPDAASEADGTAPLFPTGEAGDFRSRWQEVQVGFVDEPRNAVQQADKLVAEMMQRLAQVFSD